MATIRYTGRFADRANLTIHYGFNGWNLIAGAGDFEAEPDGGNTNYYRETEMTRLPGEGFEVTIAIPLGTRALHSVFYSKEAGAVRWDNNDGRDYAIAIETPYMGPYLTWNDDTSPEHGVVINYCTSNPTPTELEYGNTPALGISISEASEREDHHVILTGLDADTRYFYRVRGANGTNSPTYSFQTAKPSLQTFKFLVTADMQDNGDDRRWHDVANELHARHADASFLLVVGDLPWNNQPGHWWTFFDKGRQLLASKVMMPAVGNHDTPTNNSNEDTRGFERLFALPMASGSETYYSFDFANASFLCLNSENTGQFRKDAGKQFQWARAQLQSDGASNSWRFAYWHIPPYDAANRHFHQQGDFRDITSLFDGRVDWVFNGHEHLYQRMKPLRYNALLATSGKYGNEADQGVGYLVVPPAGNHPARELIRDDPRLNRYRQRLAYPVPTAAQNSVDSQIGFVSVEVSSHTIELQTYGMGTPEAPAASHVVDSVSYTK